LFKTMCLCHQAV